MAGSLTVAPGGARAKTSGFHESYSRRRILLVFDKEAIDSRCAYVTTSDDQNIGFSGEWGCLVVIKRVKLGAPEWYSRSLFWLREWPLNRRRRHDNTMACLGLFVVFIVVVRFKEGKAPYTHLSVELGVRPCAVTTFVI